MSLYKAFAKIASLTMVSRVLGFTRDILHTAILGASFVSDAFIVAFKFPNFFRRLFAEGAFNAAFIPLFSSMLASKGRQAALDFASQSLALLVCVLISIVALAELFMPQIMAVLAPGFVDEPDRYQAAIDFGRLTFPYLFFISLASLYTGVLNSFHKFSAGAAAPILLNLSLITGLMLFKENTLMTGYSVSAAVSVAGVLQLSWLIWSTHRADININWVRPRLTPETKTLLKKMGPIALSGSIFQVNLMIDIVLASLLPKGSVTYLYFADRLAELPLGVVGVTISTALMPLLSKHVELKEKQKSFDAQHKSVVTCLMFALPAATALFVIADPIIRTLFGRGAFVDPDIIATSYTLMALSFGVPAFILNKVFTTSFFAHKDTKTPLKIGIFTVSLNLILNLILMQYYAYIGLAMATAIASTVQAITNYLILHKRDWYRLSRKNIIKIFIFTASSLIMGIFLVYFYSHDFNLHKVAMLFLATGAGGLVYFGSGFILAGFKLSRFKA